MVDLFTDQLSQEEKWQIQIQECRDRVEARVMEAISIGRYKTRRKELYKKWRTQFGDDIARESAKLAEAIIKGDMEVPKWFRTRRGR